jgi:hypothetical protein
VLFLEVTAADPAEVEARLQVTGEERHGHRILGMESSAVPNAIAAVLLPIRDLTGECPHVFFDWTEATRWRTWCAFDRRQRRGRPGHPRGPPRGRTRSPAAALPPRRLSAVAERQSADLERLPGRPATDLRAAGKRALT